MSELPADSPILFACAGCSNAGRAAYDVALEIERRGDAEMSCLAGVAAGKRSFLRKLEGRQVWVVDGCRIHCALGVFDRAGCTVDQHLKLFDVGVRKSSDAAEAYDIPALTDQVLRSIAATSQPAT
jgi:uncharacterized metal-binding protein